MQVEGRIAVVTGAASGIGRGLVDALVEAQAKVVLADIEQGALDAAVAELREQGHEVLGVRTDVTDAASIAALRDATVEAYGGVDLLVNNAGVMPPARRAWESPEDDVDWVLRVNLFGVLHAVRTFVPGMIERGEPGHIVNTSSMNALAPTSHYLAYSMSKAAVVALSETLALDLADAGAPIGVSVLLPEVIRTNIGKADRNRPGVEGDESKRTFAEGFDPFETMGLEPIVLARRVVEAVREDQAWILPPADDGFMQMAIERFRLIERSVAAPGT